jgi:hypothetical protein
MPTSWMEREIQRIETLSEEEVITEVHNIMTGQNYSWHRIFQRFRETEIIDYSICREWKFLCDTKREWDQNARQNEKIDGYSLDAKAILAQLTQQNLWNAKAYRSFLVKLRVLPAHAGLGAEGEEQPND